MFRMTLRGRSKSFYVLLSATVHLLIASMAALIIWCLWKGTSQLGDPLDDPLSFRKAFTVTRQEAQRFSNFSQLLDHPDKCSGQDVHLLIFIKSATKHADRRDAIRATWGNETYIRRSKGVTIKVLFALGAPMISGQQQIQRDDQEMLEAEDRLHGDLIQQDFADTFRNLTLKVLMQFRWAHQHCGHARFVMTCDDDTLVHTPNLVDYLRDAARRDATDLWVGRVHSGTEPIRDKNSKYYLPMETYPWSTYPDYTPGSGYVVSRDVVEKIYHASLTLNASIHIDDVVMGACAYLVGVKPQDHAFFAGEATASRHPCIYRQMMNSHGENVKDMHELWEAVTDPQVSETNCSSVKEALLSVLPDWAVYRTIGLF